MIGRAPIVALALFLFIAGCSPRIQEIGPPIVPASIGEEALTMPDGVALPVMRWLPWDRAPQGVVIALHGFNDYSSGMSMPGHGLARRGFIVLAYDQRGFGRTPQRGIWPGTQALTGDLATVIRLVHQSYADLPLYLLGESMGASVIMVAMESAADLPISGIVLAAPAIWGRQTIGEFDQAILDGAAHAVPFLSVRPTGIRRVASSNRSALRRLSADPLVIKATRIDAAYGLVGLMTEAYQAGRDLGRVPTLLMFGRREGILDRGAVAEFLATLRPGAVRLALYPRGYHLLLRDFGQDQVLDDIAAWTANPEQPLPSGADRPAGEN